MHAATAAVHERDERPRETKEQGEKRRCVPDRLRAWQAQDLHAVSRDEAGEDRDGLPRA